MSKEWRDFLDYRQKVFDAIKTYLEDDNGHKSYEGCFEVTVCYPDYFNANGDAPEQFIIELHMYCIGPRRHYKWIGVTLADALAKCKQDVDCWLKEFYDRLES